MIREVEPRDMDALLDIWLTASVKAHDFVPADFWASQVDNMRNVYIPASDTFVYEGTEGVQGFYALHGDNLAAIFVAPELQGKGVGKQLLHHALAQRPVVTLSVYQANQASYQFYLSQGFKVLEEQVDEHTGHPAYVMQSAVS